MDVLLSFTYKNLIFRLEDSNVVPFINFLEYCDGRTERVFVLRFIRCRTMWSINNYTLVINSSWTLYEFYRLELTEKIVL